MESNSQKRVAETSVRGEDFDAMQAVLRAANEIGAALRAHLTQEHGVHVEDRSHGVVPTLDLLRHARERIGPKVSDPPLVGALPSQKHEEV